MAKSKTLEFDYWISSYLAFRHAQDFRRSAELIEKNNITKPVMVNIAFSCELYMKALIMWNHKNREIIGKHKLDALFGMLEISIQERIRKETDIQNWDTFLKDSADAFCAWRYYYEKDNVMFGHIGDLFAFAEVLGSICSEEISIGEFLKDGTIGKCL